MAFADNEKKRPEVTGFFNVNALIGEGENQMKRKVGAIRVFNADKNQRSLIKFFEELGVDAVNKQITFHVDYNENVKSDAVDSADDWGLKAAS